ncbi:MAG: phenylalanine--tRNA ligase subunit beta [Bacilli bacterium]|nr:phenylalanine--tRNA ligase subunit beta [Bacilli bacterium]
MKVPYSYLAKHVDLTGLTPEMVADKLTFSGAEVEGISRLASGTGLVIGHILSCVPHPDSDHLHVLRVDEGAKLGVHQIVCGASNAREGLKVIVATPGAKLPQIEIKPSIIRGVSSDGMCCSLLELGVDRKYLSEYQASGIEELPEDAPVGEANVLGYLGLDEVVLDVSVLPNRPDLYALENVAKEVACIFDRAYTPETYPSYKERPSTFKVSSDTPDCPLFCGKVYRGVKTKPSPQWVSRLLSSCGIRSINNIVDIGNLVMLLTGQPLNMYDLDKLSGNCLKATSSYQGSFLAMDGSAYELQEGDLLIVDGEKPACLAGIMTSDACRVDENSKNIVVEAAYFKGAPIRHTSNRLGLSSDSSLRFCKGINPDQSAHVFELVSYLLKELAEVEEIETTVAYDTFAHQIKTIDVSLSYINGRLGTSFTQKEVVDALTRAFFKVRENGDLLHVEVPAFRIDVDGKADLTEEVIRILGYEHVPSVLMDGRVEPQGLKPEQAKLRLIRDYLKGKGVSEALTYTLVPEKWTKQFAYLEKQAGPQLLNPITVERSFVRTNLLPSLLDVVAYNANHQEKDLAFFEASAVELPNGSQGQRLALVLAGNREGQGAYLARPYNFYDGKGLVEGIMERLEISPNRYKLLPWSLGGEEFHPYQAAEIRIGNQLVGVLGALHPLLCKELGIKNGVAFELDLKALFDLRSSPKKASIPPRFPSVKRDFAFILPSEVTFGELSREVGRAHPLIKAVHVFDVYVGEHLPEGKKSMAISITLLSEDHTLKEEEILAATEKVLNAVKAKFGAEVRG